MSNRQKSTTVTSKVRLNNNGQSSRRLWRFVKWSTVPIGVGYAFVACQHLWHLRRRRLTMNTDVEQAEFRDERELTATAWEVTCYRLLPLKAFSRALGWVVNGIDVPVFARPLVYKTFARRYGCDITEAEIQDLTAFRNLGEFFRRSIKEEVRPIDQGPCLVSPVDGYVLRFGKVIANQLEQVKGITYSLSTFLGPTTWFNSEQPETATLKNYDATLLKDPVNNKLYHCVLYLAPGDYHRFHSPVNWTVHFRRHFSGELFSVSPLIARWIAGLFSLNERAVYIGEWEHGFFSMTAVGATNVGSIKVAFDETLQTNIRRRKKGTYVDKHFKSSVDVSKGELFGEFNLGSTIVLVFEAPEEYHFPLEDGQKIRFGQPLTQITNLSNNLASAGS